MFLFLSSFFSYLFILVLEFSYCEAPKHMRSTVMSLFDIVIPIGALLDTVFILIGNAFGWNILSYQSQDENHELRYAGNLHYYFFFLATLNFINLIAFLIYGVRQTRRAKLDEDDVTAFIRANMYGSLTDRKNFNNKDAKDGFPECQRVNWFDEAS